MDLLQDTAEPINQAGGAFEKEYLRKGKKCEGKGATERDCYRLTTTPILLHCAGQAESRGAWSEGMKLSPENVGGGGKVVF